MPMNLDKFKGLSNEVRSQIEKALASNEEDAVIDAMTILATNIERSILKEAEQMQKRSINDFNVLMQRGQSQLTQEERDYYKAVQENRGFTNLDKTMPTTIFERVFEDLEKNHTLLSKIDFENTTGITKWLLSKPGAKIAKWGKLTTKIIEELESEFSEVDTTLCKLSAFLPVSKDMLDLGAVWIDKYVRTVLTEAVSSALEEAIIKGDGKDKPLGMMADLKGSVSEGVYPMKTGKALTDLSPKTLGIEVMTPLTLNGTREVGTVLMIVNPVDYWSKIFPNTTVLNANGTYVHGVMPIPSEVIQSVHVPTGKMVCGLGKDYFMGVGSSQNITFSDDYKFLEDERVYVAKQYASGQPKDNDCFLVFDISTLGTSPVELNTTISENETEKEINAE